MSTIKIKPTHEAADAFWNCWEENGETHKHGYYESTWGAINAALACGVIMPESAPEQAAKDLLKGIEKGLSGEELLAFARRSVYPSSYEEGK